MSQQGIFIEGHRDFDKIASIVLEGNCFLSALFSVQLGGSNEFARVDDLSDHMWATKGQLHTNRLNFDLESTLLRAQDCCTRMALPI
jgi:hypothetical protein